MVEEYVIRPVAINKDPYNNTSIMLDELYLTWLFSLPTESELLPHAPFTCFCVRGQPTLIADSGFSFSISPGFSSNVTTRTVEKGIPNCCHNNSKRRIPVLTYVRPVRDQIMLQPLSHLLRHLYTISTSPLSHLNRALSPSNHYIHPSPNTYYTSSDFHFYNLASTNRAHNKPYILQFEKNKNKIKIVTNDKRPPQKPKEHHTQERGVKRKDNARTSNTASRPRETT